LPPPTRKTLFLGSYSPERLADQPVCTDPSLEARSKATPAAAPASTDPGASFLAPPPVCDNSAPALENSARIFSSGASNAGTPHQPGGFDFAAHGMSEPAYRSMLASQGLTDEGFSALTPEMRRTYLAGFNGQLLFRSHPRYANAGSVEKLRLITEFYKESYHAPEDMSGVKLTSGHLICDGQARAYWKIYGELPPLAPHQEIKPWSRLAGYNPVHNAPAGTASIPDGLALVEPSARGKAHPRMVAAFERWLTAVKPPKHIADAARAHFIEACERASADTAGAVRMTDGESVPKAQVEALAATQGAVRTETKRFYLAAYTGQRMVEDVALRKVHASEMNARGATYATRGAVSWESAQFVEAAIRGEGDLEIVRLSDGREILKVHERMMREVYGDNLPKAASSSAKEAVPTVSANERALMPAWVASRIPSQQQYFRSAVATSLEALHKHPSFTDKPYARQMQMQSILLNDLRSDGSWTHFNNLEISADGTARVRTMDVLLNSAIAREATIHRQQHPGAATPPPKAAPTASTVRTEPTDSVAWSHREAAAIRDAVELKLATIEELASYHPSDRHILAARYANEWRSAFTPEQRAALAKHAADGATAEGFSIPPRIALSLMVARDALIVSCGLKPERAMQLINAHRSFFMRDIPRMWLALSPKARQSHMGGYIEFAADKAEGILRTDPELARSVKAFRRETQQREALEWKRANAAQISKGKTPLSEQSKPHRPGRLNLVRYAAYQRNPQNWGIKKIQGGLLSVFGSLPGRPHSRVSTKSPQNPTTNSSAPEHAGTDTPVKLHSAGPEAFLIALYGEHALEPRAHSADNVITVSQSDMKAFEALAETYGISPERVPELLAGQAGIDAQKNVARRIETNLTPEKVAAWLEKPEGQQWLEANREALADTFRNRWKAGAPGLAMAVVGLLGARKVAEIVGIDPVKQPVEHFILTAYTIHGCNEVGSAAGEVLVRRSARLPMDFVKTEVVGAGENAALRMTLSSRTTLGRAFFGALTKNFAGKGAAAIASNAVTLPLRQLPSMGSAIACSRITDLVLQKTVPSMDPETRTYITDGVLIAPIAYRIAAGTRPGKNIAAALARTKLGARLAESAAARALLGSGALSSMRIAGRIVAKGFSSGFALDMTTLAAQLAFTGWDAGAYRRSANDRIQKRLHEEEDELLADQGLGARIFYGATTSTAKAMEFISPVFSAEIERRLANSDGMLSINTTGRDFELEIYAEDLAQSEIIRDELPQQILLAMTAGVGNDIDTPEFYRSLEIDSLGNEIELQEDEEKLLGDIRMLYARMSSEGSAPADIMAARTQLITERLPSGKVSSFEHRIQAWELQESLRSLHFLGIPENDDVRAMADDDGAITDQGELLKLALPKLAPEDRRAAILEMRKVGLVARILEAERTQAPEQERLIALAKEVGLTDERGELRKDHLYDQALAIAIRATHVPA
jgi:hypothetical protein